MSEFKILNNPHEISYNKDIYFETYDKEYFLEEVEKHVNVKKQAGYSKIKNCEYISLILLRLNESSGEFAGYSISSTCLLKKYNIINDSNNNKDFPDEEGYSYVSIYHVLPDKKIVEYHLTKSYEEELENIYESISKIRSYYNLLDTLPENETPAQTKKLKL